MAKQIRAILTPEQIEKFKAIQKEREQKFDKFREHHGKRLDKPGTEK
jgi:Spy/CpxP family protein refolding chaperone